MQIAKQPPSPLAVPWLRVDPQTQRFALLVIFIVAVILRLGALVVMGPRLGVDSQSYLAQGTEILRQGPLSFLSFAAEQSPLYSLLFSLCAAIAGPHADWAIGIVQAVLGGLTALFLAAFTRRATNDPLAGILAGALAAVHITFVFWSAYVLTDTLLLFLLAAIALLILDLGLVSGWVALRRAVANSTLLLLLVLTRRTNILVSAVLLVVAAVLARGKRSVLSGLALPVLLVLAVFATGALTTRSGTSIGNRAGAYAWQALYMGLQWTEQGRATEGVDIHLSTIADDAERGAFYRVQSLDWIRSDPGYFAGQILRKLKVLWQPYLPEDSTFHKLINASYLLPLYVLGIVGWLSSRRNVGFLAIATCGIAAFTLVCAITFVDYDQRYRLPAELFLIPLSAVGLERVLVWLTARITRGVGESWQRGASPS